MLEKIPNKMRALTFLGPGKIELFSSQKDGVLKVAITP